MVQNETIKRQAYFNGVIYDILGVITLGNRKYCIIGKNNGNTFYDITFVERKLEDGKIVYVASNSSYSLSVAKSDFSDLKGQVFMNTIINDIRDGINGTNKEEMAQNNVKNVLMGSKDIMNYIQNALQTIENNEDIKAFFDNNGTYENEEQFDKSMDSLITYYHLILNGKSNSPKNEEVQIVEEILDLEPKVEEIVDEEIDELYRKLEDTQNYGASLIPDAIKNYSDEYIPDPTNNLFIESSSKEESSIFMDRVEPAVQEPVVQEPVVEAFAPVGESNVDEEPVIGQNNLSFQQKMYLENEKKLQSSVVGPEQLGMDNPAKTKTLTLRSNGARRSNAAYISISVLLYLIGSFELLLSIILLAKII